MEKHTFGYEKDYLGGFDSSRCYIEDASLDYQEYLGAFIDDYLLNEKGIDNEDLSIKLFDLALDKFYYISVFDDEIRDFIETELKNMKGNYKMNKSLERFIPIFNIWKGQVDKIMLDNNIDSIVAEHEFYSHLASIYDIIKSGKTIYDTFGYDLDESEDYIVSYDIINDLINAIDNCYYVIGTLDNKKVMVIDDKDSYYLNETKTKIERNEVL